VTTEARAEQAVRIRTAGADSVLIKPIVPQTLVEAMQRLLEQSSALRQRSGRIRADVSAGLRRSAELLARSVEEGSRRSKAHRRFATSLPPVSPPPLTCPSCDRPLTYQRSQIGGVNATNAEQWDYFVCPMECGAFQYRQRTRTLRHVS
jgi:hypothetical protein